MSDIFISEKQKLIIFMMNNIKVISFNCGGLKRNVELINLLLNECDILCVQETLLFESSNDILNRFSIDYNFEYQGATKTNVFAGRPRGGLVTFWKSSLNSMVSVTFKTDRCICIKLNSCGKESIVVNTYLPCDYGNEDCLMYYRGALIELETIESRK